MTASAPNLWRYVQYEDDGHIRYQCLPCKGQFTTGQTPGYMNEGVYVATWNFCPLCGTKWDGMRVTGEYDMGPQYGERRRRIRQALDEAPLHPESSRPTAAWVVERLGENQGVWRASGYIRRPVPAIKVRDYLNYQRAQHDGTQFRARILPWADVYTLYVGEIWIR